MSITPNIQSPSKEELAERTPANAPNQEKGNDNRELNLYSLNACKLWYGAKKIAFPNQYRHQRHILSSLLWLPFS